jgi:hypothetical protein
MQWRWQSESANIVWRCWQAITCLSCRRMQHVPRNIDNHPRTAQWPVSGQRGLLLAPLLQSLPPVLTLLVHSQTRLQNLENGGALDNFVSFSPQDFYTVSPGRYGVWRALALMGISFGQEGSVQKCKLVPPLPPSAWKLSPPPPNHLITGIWSLSPLLGFKIIVGR